jgi:hypothetical protein
LPIDKKSMHELQRQQLVNFERVVTAALQMTVDDMLDLSRVQVRTRT